MLQEYEYFFAMKSCKVDAWDICDKSFLILKSNFVIGQYINTVWYNKSIINDPDIFYECIIIKIRKQSNHKNTVIRQLNYAGVNYSNISEVYLHGIISFKSIKRTKEKIKKTMLEANSTMVSMPVYAKMTNPKDGDEIIITLQGEYIDNYTGEITYSFTLPLFKTSIQ